MYFMCIQLNEFPQLIALRVLLWERTRWVAWQNEWVQKLGLPGKILNHSLRADAVTEMFNTGIPEKVIQDRSRHRSLDDLGKYESTSEKKIVCLPRAWPF